MQTPITPMQARTRLPFGRIFLHGLAALLPIVITISVITWLATMVEAYTGYLVRLAIPDRYYLPGMGLFVGILTIFGVGLLMHFYLVKRVFDVMEHLLERVPVVKSIYSTMRDFLGYFEKSKAKAFNQVVMITMPDEGTRLFGLVARESFEDLPAGIGDRDTVAVYLPMAYNIGGFTVYVPRARVQPVDMSLEDAMRFALTAGLTKVAAVTPAAGTDAPAKHPPPDGPPGN